MARGVECDLEESQRQLRDFDEGPFDEAHDHAHDLIDRGGHKKKSPFAEMIARTCGLTGARMST